MKVQEKMTMKDETRGEPTGNYKSVHCTIEGDHQRAEARGWALLSHRNLLVNWLNSEVQGEESLKRQTCNTACLFPYYMAHA